MNENFTQLKDATVVASELEILIKWSDTNMPLDAMTDNCMGVTVMTHQGGVQFLSDELSEVSRNRQLTVQFLCADFAAVSELSGKNLRWVLKIDCFVYVCAYVFRNCCLSSSYSALFSAEYRKSSLRNWTPPRTQPRIHHWCRCDVIWCLAKLDHSTLHVQRVKLCYMWNKNIFK